MKTYVIKFKNLKTGKTGYVVEMNPSVIRISSGTTDFTKKHTPVKFTPSAKTKAIQELKELYGHDYTFRGEEWKGYESLYKSLTRRNPGSGYIIRFNQRKAKYRSAFKGAVTEYNNKTVELLSDSCINKGEGVPVVFPGEYETGLAIKSLKQTFDKSYTFRKVKV